MGGFL